MRNEREVWVGRGLYDFPLREYSTQGRWPNPDPLGRGATCPKDPQTQNRYAYVRNNPMTYTDPTGGYLEGPYCPLWDASCSGGGGCWSPDDPFCDPCAIDPSACSPFPVGGGGGGGGGGGFIGGNAPEKPRPFPWQLLPPLFFASGGPPAPDCSKGKCKPPCGKFFMHNLCNPGDFQVERWVCPAGCSLDDCGTAATNYSLECDKRGKNYYATCSQFQGFGQVPWCDCCKKNK